MCKSSEMRLTVRLTQPQKKKEGRRSGSAICVQPQHDFPLVFCLFLQIVIESQTLIFAEQMCQFVRPNVIIVFFFKSLLGGYLFFSLLVTAQSVSNCFITTLTYQL